MLLSRVCARGLRVNHTPRWLPSTVVRARFARHASSLTNQKDPDVARILTQLESDNLRKSDVRWLAQMYEQQQGQLYEARQKQGYGPAAPRSKFARALGIIYQMVGIGAVAGMLYLLYSSLKSEGGRVGLSGFMEDNFSVIHPPDTEDGSDDDDEDGSSEGSRKWPTFDDVCGNEEAKEDLEDVVNFLRTPDKYQDMGIKVPKGVLLCGPPGVGKTLMARALAGEAKVSFIHADGSSFDQMFVGVGAARVRSLFQKAREAAPAIIFIDEFDAVAENRQSFNSNRMTLNQLLSEMDGFNQSDEVIVVASTNLPQRLDPAAIRSGRFDRHVYLNLPDRNAREAILILNLKEKKCADSIDTASLAAESVGMSGADIANLVNYAAIEVVKAEEDAVTTERLRDALATVAMGRARKSLKLSPEVVRGTAFHEAGHTTVSLFTPGATGSSQMTVLPRGQSLGSTWSKPSENQEYSRSKEEMLASIDVCMGGMAAEELIFGVDKVSTGASNDFQKATSIATHMVAQCGMSERFGKISLSPDEVNKKLSPRMRNILDDEVREILDKSYARVVKLLQDKHSVMTELAETVIAQETLQEHEILSIAGLGANGATPIRS